MDGMGHAVFSARSVKIGESDKKTDENNSVDKKLSILRLEEINVLKAKNRDLRSQLAMVMRELLTYKERTVQYLTIFQIIEIICDFYQFSRQLLLSPQRQGEIVRARHVGMFVCKNNTIRSLPEIGKAFGGKDHTTVLHAYRKIEKLRKTDICLDAEIFYIEYKINEKLIEREQTTNMVLLRSPMVNGQSAGPPQSAAQEA